MGRHTGPKERLSRREGVNLFLKGARSFSEKAGVLRKPYPPGQHGNARRTRLSNFGIQLREKQKVKRTYGLREKQFKNLVDEATRVAKVKNSDRGLELLRLLEMRLDNVLYLMGLSSSRNAARQAVVHKHVLVNGDKMTAPSFKLNVGDKVELKMAKLAPAEILVSTPAWLEKDQNKGKVLSEPLRDEIDEGIKENLIIEFYSR
jgi:small subunit ribosomal protein S4